MKMGPGVLITSAFIGPGTVTVCLLSGVSAGLELLWAVIFSTLATIILQDMCVRLGYYSRMGLEESIFKIFKNPIIKTTLTIFIFVTIIIGNTAYQSGNVAGTALGIDMMEMGIDRSYILIGIFMFCLVCILIGNYEFIKNVLSVLVFLMSITFILVAIFNFPNFGDFIEGCLVPKFKKENLLLVIGLIGTTVVPYNLFLHTTLVAQQKDIDIRSLRLDAMTSIALGGVISMAIVMIGSHGKGMDIRNAAEMASVLGNTTGVYSKYLLGLGLCAAGLSSALTAPMAAGLVSAGLFGWEKNFKDIRLKSILIIVLTIGFIIAFTQTNTIKVIQLAQVANGILLPLFAVFLLWILNDRDILKVHKNNMQQNILSAIVVGITIVLALKSLFSFFQS